MIKNFTELKKQLQELSPVINSFKSESVQLRIVELIFHGEAPHDEDPSSGKPQTTTRRRRKTPRSKNKTSAMPKQLTAAGKKKGRRGGRKGPAAILGELIDEGFFQSKRTINAVIDHASSHKARIFKANELSGPLARFVRDKRLKRHKNSDGQYEYYK